MSPTYSYACDTCSITNDRVSSIAEYVSAYACDTHPRCGGTMHRTLAGNAPSIAAVPGGGNSPARQGSA